MYTNFNKQTVLMNIPKFVGITIVMVLFFLTLLASKKENNRYKIQLRGEVTTQLSSIRMRLENEIHRDMQHSRELLTFVSENPELNNTAIERLSNKIIRDSQYINTIALAPNNTITSVYGLNTAHKNRLETFSEFKKKWPEIETIAQAQKNDLTRSNKISKDNNSLNSVAPIYLTQEENNGIYWGFVSIVFNVDKLFRMADLETLSHNITLAIYNNDGNQSQHNIYGDIDLLKTDAVKLNINVAGGTWIIAGKPQRGWLEFSPNFYFIWFIWCSLGLLAGWLVMVKLESYRLQKNQLTRSSQQIELTDKAMNGFVANMSHEIRTPLNPIVNLTYLALKDEIPNQTRHYLNEIQSAAILLRKTVDNVLEFSNIKAGKLTIQSIPFSLDHFVSNFIKPYEKKAKEKNISFHLNLSSDLHPYVIGDVLRLGQVLSKLLNNAIKFTTKGAVKLIIKVNNKSDKKTGLSFTIKDTGCGMTPEQIEYLFQGFDHSSSSITREYEGTGLGLSICQKLIQLMGGNISVKSVPDEGSQFTFDLDFELATEEMISDLLSKSSLPPQQLPSYQGESVLLVEDNKVNQDVVQNLLKGTGLKIYIANNGQEAVFMTIARHYDLILMDIQMPIMDGYEAAETIRQKKRNKDIPIIAMTAHSFKGDRDKSLASGMSDHITKPIDPVLFYRTIMHWLPAIGTIAQPKTNTLKPTTSLYNLPGVDTKIGLKKVLQDQGLYHKILIEFNQDHMNDAEHIRNCIENNDIKKAKNLAHTIKGAAGHIGALELYKAAALLETELNQEELIDVTINNFQIALDEVVTSIAVLDTKSKIENHEIDSDQKINKKDIPFVIQELFDKLQQASPQASELVTKLSQSLGSEYQEAIEDLQQMVDTFDFDESIKILMKIKKALT
ncbi:MAG: ATP-binding protein [Marinicellaceae bacterium]